MSFERVLICQQINLSLEERIRAVTNVCLSYFIDGPICSHKSQLSSQFYTGIRRSVNLTCYMNDGNPSKLNFTWHLPNGITRLGYYLNITSSFITVLPNQIEDFGQATCRAQNELGLFGECHINMIMGGKYYFLKEIQIFTFLFLRYTRSN
jgi:hypothetical protein